VTVTGIFYYDLLYAVKLFWLSGLICGNGLYGALLKSPRNYRNVHAELLGSHEPHADEIPTPPVIRHADLEVEYGVSRPTLRWAVLPGCQESAIR
jgi:hypothetical protein